MIITLKWLVEHGACTRGRNFFKRKYARGLDTESNDSLAYWFSPPIVNESPGLWIADLIIMVATDFDRFRDCRWGAIRYIPQHRKPLFDALTAYLRARRSCTNVYAVWEKLATRLSADRQLACLQQVARAVEANDRR